MLEDFLYQLSAQEAITAPAMQRFVRRDTASAAQVQFARTIVDCPLDKCVIVTSLCALGAGGAGQNCTLIRFRHQDQQNNVLWEYRMSPTSWHGGAAGLQFEHNLPNVRLIMMPGDLMVVVTDFSAAAVANGIENHCAGIFVPKGNIQLR